MKVSEYLNESPVILAALGSVGLIALIFLIIFLSFNGNFNIPYTTSSFTNQTITLNCTGAVLPGTENLINPSISNVIMTNKTGGEIINSYNYKVSGNMIYAIDSSCS